MAKTYDYCEIKLEEYEAPGLPMCDLSVGAEFSFSGGWEPDGFDPGEPGELELGAVEVLSARMGEDRLEATPEEIQALQKALRSDREALGRIEEQLGELVS